MKIRMMGLVVASALLMASCGSSRKSSSTSTNSAYGVPASIQSNFGSQYPSASNVTWSHYNAQAVPFDWDVTDWTVLGPNDYMVSFDQGGNRYYSWYDANGNWIGTTY